MTIVCQNILIFFTLETNLVEMKLWLEIQDSNKKLEVMEIPVHNIFDISPESVENIQSTLCLKFQGV